MKRFSYIFGIFFVLSVCFIAIGWKVDGFDFFKAQDYKFYFQSWISFAGATFAIVMSIATFVIYKKSEILSLKFTALSFLFIFLAYVVIGYHTSYCKVCSDLSLCGASHNYPDFIVLVTLTLFIVVVLLRNAKFKLQPFKIFSYGLILAATLLFVILFFSIKYMEIPNIAPYVFTKFNLQGFVFIFPLILIALIYVYFKKNYKVTYVVTTIFFLIFISFIPQAYHIFYCTECNNMECSEFYDLSGLLMFIAIGIFFYSIYIYLENQDKISDD